MTVSSDPRHRLFGRRRWIPLTIAASALALALVVAIASVGYRKVWDVPLPSTRAVQGPPRRSRAGATSLWPRALRGLPRGGRGAPGALTRRGRAADRGSGETTYLGTWRAPNLTPDAATGIGNVTDAEFARMIRYGVNRDGHIGFPFMDSLPTCPKRISSQSCRSSARCRQRQASLRARTSTCSVRLRSPTSSIRTRRPVPLADVTPEARRATGRTWRNRSAGAAHATRRAA